LAHVIAGRLICSDRQTVGHIGFSLGCHIIKNCIKELYKISLIDERVKYIVSNIVLIVGATSMTEKKKYFEIVNGRAIKVHSEYDNILKMLYSQTIKKDAVGNIKVIMRSLLMSILVR
jgi:hypothetical protein